MTPDPSHLSYASQVQFLKARVEALSSAGDRLKHWVVKGPAKAKQAINVWELTKIGGKRADRKKD